jgi:hypothetical protein
LRARARMVAENSINVDWVAERARLEDRVLREKFPGKQRGALTPEVQAEVDKLVKPQIESIDRRIKEEQVPALVAKQERWITYAEQSTGALFMLALNPKFFDLSMRVMVPLENADDAAQQ